MLAPVSHPYNNSHRRPRQLPRQARFREVVQPHMKAAHALARFLTGKQAESEDIVQEACLRAFRALDRFRGSNSRAWVLTIVRHTAYDWMRRHRHAPERIADFDAPEDQSALQQHDTPESLLLREQDAGVIRQAIQSLPDAFREALLLRYHRGLTYREIAGRTGVPAGTVMSRLCRARRRLATRLAEVA